MWLLIPSSDRPAARKLVKRIDEILGYPRTEAGTKRGGGVHAESVYTETAMDIRLHDDTGATVLHGAVAINLDSDLAQALAARNVDVDGVKRRLSQVIDDRGWGTSATLPGLLVAWSRVTPRDGQEGSADGVPIPEGAE